MARTPDPTPADDSREDGPDTKTPEQEWAAQGDRTREDRNGMKQPGRRFRTTGGTGAPRG